LWVEISEQPYPHKCKSGFPAFDLLRLMWGKLFLQNVASKCILKRNSIPDLATSFTPMNESKKPQKSPSIFLMCLALFGLPAAACAWHGDYVFAAVLAVIGFGCMSGFKIGGVRALATVAAVVAAVWYSPQLSGDLEPKLTEWFSTTGLTNRLLSLGLISISIIVLTLLVTTLLTGWMFKRSSGLKSLNHWTGFLTGGAEAAVGALIFLGGLIVVQPTLPAPSDTDASIQNVVSTYAAKVIEHTEASYIGPIVEEYNPFVRFPQLNCFAQVQNTVAVLQDPSAVRRVMNDPRIKAMEADPAMQEAFATLLLDEEISSILNSEGPNDREKFMALMNSPAVLDLLDQPGFLAEASKVIAEMKSMSSPLHPEVAL